MKTLAPPRLRGFRAGLAAGVLLLLAAADARAATIVLDASTGAAYDSVGDGWAFADGNPAPPNPPPDGVGDLGGQNLGIAYIAGVVEMRALSEFPLAPLAGLTAADVVGATFTYVVDDVFSTFGPGATFDNTAGDPIAVYAYPADGTVAVADFSPAGLSSVAVVPTGVITDATLAITGPVPFHVDATQKIKDALTAGDAAIGFLLATLDSPTGISINATRPVVAIEVADLAPPAFGAAQRKCQKAIAKAAGALVKTRQAELAKCLDAVLLAVAGGKPLPPVEAKCRKALDASDPKSKLAKAIASVGAGIAKGCGGLTPAHLGSPCDGGAADFAAVAACLVADHATVADALVAREYAHSCPLIGAVNLSSAFPGLCTP